MMGRNCLFLVALFSVAAAWHLPGFSQTEYSTGDPIELKVSKLWSPKSKTPYNFYSLPFCRPNTLKSSKLSIGEILRGDRTSNTPYFITMNKNQTCTLLCRGKDFVAKSYDTKQVKQLEKFINMQYRATLLMDSLPVHDEKALGFAIGAASKAKGIVLHNHLDFTIAVREAHPGRFVVTDFRVRGRSINQQRYVSVRNVSHGPDAMSCRIDYKHKTINTYLALNSSLGNEKRTSVVWSYSVHFIPDAAVEHRTWSTTPANPDRLRTIGTAAGVVSLLVGAVAAAMARTVRADIRLYNGQGSVGLLDAGWRAVHGDVFRAPKHRIWLAALIGTGIHLLFVAIATILYIAFVIKLYHRYTALDVALAFYVLFSPLCGWVAGRLAATWQAPSDPRAAFAAASLFPLAVFTVGFVIDIVLWAVGSTAAAPIGTMAIIVMVWALVVVPLIMLGFTWGQSLPIAMPVEPTKLPRPIPRRPYAALRLVVHHVLAGLAPFLAALYELYNQSHALWNLESTHTTGLAGLVLLLTLAAVALVCFVMVYFQLSAEEYRWWWTSFTSGAAGALFVFLYSVVPVLVGRDHVDIASRVVFTGYSLIACSGLALVGGAVGLLSSFTALRLMYAAVKVD
eukprot:m.20408 g.20408  ORF g.20408 m.20408 type:complete len:623 (+) comp7830_c0_seq2:159-2027(+)